jgi:hypothetical protein
MSNENLEQIIDRFARADRLNIKKFRQEIQNILQKLAEEIAVEG